MTILAALCHQRGCIYFRGFQKDEEPVCLAYPLGIPKDIQSGESLHLEPRPDDGGYQFKKATDEAD